MSPGVIVDSWAINDRAAYVDHVVAALEGRSLGGMKIVVDAANGAAFEVAGDVFTRAGAEVLLINATPDGTNINRECGATEPAGLARMVVEQGAFAGLALDGDGDRLIAVDETGPGHRRRSRPRHLRRRHALEGPAARRHRGRHGDDEPRVPAGDGRRRGRGGRDRGRRPVRARGAATRATTRSAASRAGT